MVFPVAIQVAGAIGGAAGGATTAMSVGTIAATALVPGVLVLALAKISVPTCIMMLYAVTTTFAMLKTTYLSFEATQIHTSTHKLHADMDRLINQVQHATYVEHTLTAETQTKALLQMKTLIDTEAHRIAETEAALQYYKMYPITTFLCCATNAADVSLFLCNVPESIFKLQLKQHGVPIGKKWRTTLVVDQYTEELKKISQPAAKAADEVITTYTETVDDVMSTEALEKVKLTMKQYASIICAVLVVMVIILVIVCMRKRICSWLTSVWTSSARVRPRTVISHTPQTRVVPFYELSMDKQSMLLTVVQEMNNHLRANYRSNTAPHYSFYRALEEHVYDFVMKYYEYKRRGQVWYLGIKGGQFR